MKKSDLTAKTKTELTREADKLRLKLNQLRTDRFLKEVKNIRQIRTTRRQLARTLTAVNQAKDKE
jgi:ribosomal protein L29